MTSRVISAIIGLIIGGASIFIFVMMNFGASATGAATPVASATTSPAVASATPTVAPTPTMTMTAEELISATQQLEKIQSVRMPAARIVIPKIGLDSKVIEVGTKVEQGVLIWDTPPYDVGHYSDTADPGEPGNIVMSGHISTTRAGSVFKHLPEVAVGDAILLFTADDEEFLYNVVETKVVLPTETGVMAQTPDRTLTLITCVPDGVYDHRLIVIAKQV